MNLDVSMPRDLRQRRRRIGYAAIVAVGIADTTEVFRLATAENIEGHLGDLQPGRWEPLHFARVVWTPGMAVARTITARTERFLADTGYALGQHWFNAPLDLLDQLITAEARSLNTRTWSHAELVEKLRKQADDEADRFAQGVY
ncbi:hypothetical protein [Chelativorans sp. AA-79]|uniref:hypothetical protein n=1 Tax=Chelativorans sp. AA-79 TaxID=3028735 RepID=UPI0023F65604|nr:hypothetical protein [Chelativorans sp. AA-79]WEX10318.1 hypothetical protein PVE73_04990 [Chelativorans sp. AA-79]